MNIDRLAFEETPMQMNDYQYEALKFARYKDHLYPFMALAEEAGEVMGKIAKFTRKYEQPNFPANTLGLSEEEKVLMTALKKELGDVLWQVAACARSINCNLDEIAVSNLYKLRDREERNCIVGEGDDR